MYEQRNTQKILFVTAVCYTNGGLEMHILWSDCKRVSEQTFCLYFVGLYNKMYHNIEQRLDYILLGHYEENFFEGSDQWNWKSLGQQMWLHSGDTKWIPKNCKLVSFVKNYGWKDFMDVKPQK